ncbi:MAG: hypothetical protein LQ339_004785 [Xanthoria mediterranea]|nr:MAG: hypothetical protein LQ339_004785 [Xanthoria mediterranea]
MGLYDLGVYHILRATLITTSGKSVMTRPQIFRRVFATTNATPNIANVQFVLIEAYSISEAWETPHFLQSEMQIDLLITQHLNKSSCIIAEEFHRVNEAEAEKAFSPIFQIDTEIRTLKRTGHHSREIESGESTSIARIRCRN